MDQFVIPDAELQRTLAIKLRLMPKHIWRELRKQEEVDASKRGTGVRYDPYKAVAEYLVVEFQKSGHAVTRRMTQADRTETAANGREPPPEGS
ncbi:MAG: hypothetical protein H0W74_09910 [Sphingosinicella sp.]|nr:hypothetical protein [Sphingosinicella sp.]